jgi:hypothetical protein
MDNLGVAIRAIPISIDAAARAEPDNFARIVFNNKLGSAFREHSTRCGTACRCRPSTAESDSKGGRPHSLVLNP